MGEKLGEMNLLTLAFMGDAVYETFVRERMIQKYPKESTRNLHLRTVSLVQSAAQAKAILAILSGLTEEEQNIYRRGRNTKSTSVPKHGDMAEYRMATGLEALLGYLYLDGRLERLQEVLALLERVGWRRDD